MYVYVSQDNILFQLQLTPFQLSGLDHLTLVLDSLVLSLRQLYKLPIVPLPIPEPDALVHLLPKDELSMVRLQAPESSENRSREHDDPHLFDVIVNLIVIITWNGTTREWLSDTILHIPGSVWWSGVAATVE